MSSTAAAISTVRSKAARARAKLDTYTGLRGAQAECPCCSATFELFRHYSGRPRAACPNCGARERHRALWLYLRDEVVVRRVPWTMLHFAPEPEISEKLREVGALTYTTADLEPGRADEAFDITAIPHPEGSFDLVLISHVLEHVPHDERALAEIFRILTPGGRAILQHPIRYRSPTTYEDFSITSEADRATHFGQFDHVRVYGRDFIERVRRAGFAVTHRRFEQERDFATRMRYGLHEYTGDSMRGMDLYIAVKPDTGRRGDPAAT